MHVGIYDRLKDVAREGSYTTYADIAPLAALDMAVAADRDEITRILGEIARHEQNAARPMLTAVVIHQNDNLPGNGFFTIAREFGRFDGVDPSMFWINSLNEVHKFWQSQ